MSDESTSRWASRRDVQRGDDYDARWAEMERAGQNPHGEADFVMGLEPSSVLDAGCGTGRLAIELERRGIDVVGVDLDDQMLTAARTNAPDIEWVTADLVGVQLDRKFDVVAMAGNVMIFVASGTEGAVVANLATHLRVGGLLVAGFELRTALSLEGYDELCSDVGLSRVGRFATWDREPFVGGSYAVSVHQLVSLT